MELKRSELTSSHCNDGLASGSGDLPALVTGREWDNFKPPVAIKIKEQVRRALPYIHTSDPRFPKQRISPFSGIDRFRQAKLLSVVIATDLDAALLKQPPRTINSDAE